MSASVFSTQLGAKVSLGQQRKTKCYPTSPATECHQCHSAAPALCNIAWGDFENVFLTHAMRHSLGVFGPSMFRRTDMEGPMHVQVYRNRGPAVDSHIDYFIR